MPLPLSGYPVLGPIVSSTLVPYYFDWLVHPDYDSYWRQWSIERHYSKMPIGAYHVGGWYDVFLRGTLHNYVGMRKQANSAWARNHQRLTIGPWIHDGPKDGKAGEIDFGSSATFHPDDGPVPWYDELLKNVPSAQTKPVKLFVMGINEWREEDDWPLPQTQYRHYHFRSDGHANSSSGNGELVTEMPKHEPSDSFIYGPSNPVPTRGGNLCCSPDNDRINSGAYDQRETGRRPDVLVYTTPAFAHDFEVTGPLVAEVYVSSSAEDTDITAKIVDVWPNGYALNLADGIQRLRYRCSPDKPEMMHPGTIYKIAIDLGATSNVFRAGHRLCIEVSSSNFPRFDRNLNTAQSPEQGSRFVKAQNRIYHDAVHPSAVILPVIPPK
jgi:putative CocE/NonD family hydrolase